MVFSSLPFLFLYMPIVFVIYYLLPNKAKNYFLLVVSLLFYAWGEPVYVFLMILTCLVGYISAIFMEDKPKHKKLNLVLTILFDLAILAFFKYSNFAIDILNNIFSLSIDKLSLSLPIGISFYTFQILSYNVDVYRGDVKAERNFGYLSTYVALFPQLIAGPIVRYSTISEELHTRKITFEKFNSGIVRFVIGLGKKVILANALGALNTACLASNEPSIVLAWISSISFGLQIYLDFSAYSDMAIGMGKMLGFSFLENFNYPYMASSITDFWRRWHISLSSFFKDYVYIPLGGNRCSKLINIRNILIVWGLTGLWHGASMNFVIWGLYFALLLITEKFILKKLLEKTPKVILHIYTLILVTISWTIFMCEDFIDFKNVFLQMFGINTPLISTDTLYILNNYVLVIILAIIACTTLPKKLYLKLETIFSKSKLNPLFETMSIICIVLILVVSTAYLVNNSYNPFLYFRF